VFVRIVVAILLLIGAAASDAVDDDRVSGARRDVLPDFSRLNIARVVYDSDDSEGMAYYAYDGRVWARWETDYPEGEENFVRRLAKLTRIEVNPSVPTRRFDAADLGNYPLLFMSDAGWMMLSDKEKKAAADYLAKGGFIWIDRLWGEAEWKNFADAMRTLLNGKEWRAIPPDHPVFHTVFDLQELPQVPALPFARPGGTSAEPAGFHKYPAVSTDKAQLRGWFDDAGRLMVVADYNSDLCDGFEREAFGQWYFETYSTKAYMMGVNIVTYAMTH
jgi:hypothetical protein